MANHNTSFANDPLYQQAVNILINSGLSPVMIDYAARAYEIFQTLHSDKILFRFGSLNLGKDVEGSDSEIFLVSIVACNQKSNSPPADSSQLVVVGLRTYVQSITGEFTDYPPHVPLGRFVAEIGNKDVMAYFSELPRDMSISKHFRIREFVPSSAK